jgi:hypothetical protein
MFSGNFTSLRVPEYYLLGATACLSLQSVQWSSFRRIDLYMNHVSAVAVGSQFFLAVIN